MVPRLIAETKGKARFLVEDPNDHMQKWWAKGLFYEAGLLSHMCGIHSGGTWIDVGSSIGNHTLFFALYCADQVLSVEPVLSSIAHQRRVLKANGVLDKVMTINTALSDRMGRGRMVPFGGDLHNAGMFKLEDGDEVDVIKLDELIYTLDIKDVRVAKIDVEWHEERVVKGMLQLLERDRPALYIELSPKDDYYVNMVTLLAQHGYKPTGKRFNKSPTYEFTFNE